MRELLLSLAALLPSVFFRSLIFGATPQLTERLEEASLLAAGFFLSGSLRRVFRHREPRQKGWYGGTSGFMASRFLTPAEISTEKNRLPAVQE